MKPQLRRDTNTITIANFWENHLLKKYNYTPPYQRNSIWSDEKQSFLIDSILRNFPIPPIFLRQRIETETGKTTYEVIDGKQRLTSLTRFILNDIPCSTELADDGQEDDEIAGKYFRDFDSPALSEYKKHFWRYPIPIEYIDTDNTKLIDNIFDRLNRNGEPLTGQELRNAKYHGSQLLNFVIEKSEVPFWRARLANLDLARMEHYEFISEALFVLLEKGPQNANQDEIDSMYKKYTDKSFDVIETSSLFDSATRFLESCNVEYDALRLRGVSHLYGLWCFAYHCYQLNINPEEMIQPLRDFYTLLRMRTDPTANIQTYSASMAARTKEKFQRIRRVNALCDACEIPRFIN